MCHAVGLLFLPKLDDAFGAAAQVDVVVELGGRVRVFQEFDEIRHAKGFPGFAVAQFFERVDDVAQFFGGDAVPNPCVAFAGNPFQLLAGAANGEHRQTVCGFGHQVQIAAESAVVFAIERGEFFLRQAADDLPRFAVAFGAVVEIGGKGGVFGGTVAAGQAEQEAAAADLFHRRGFFGGEHRFAQRRHIARRAERNVLGERGEITQRYRRVVNLRDIAKTRVVKRHIAHPQRGNAALVGGFYHGGEVVHFGHGAVGIAFEGRNQAQCEFARLESAGETAMVLQAFG